MPDPDNCHYSCVEPSHHTVCRCRQAPNSNLTYPDNHHSLTLVTPWVLVLPTHVLLKPLSASVPHRQPTSTLAADSSKTLKDPQAPGRQWLALACPVPLAEWPQAWHLCKPSLIFSVASPICLQAQHSYQLQITCSSGSSSSWPTWEPLPKTPELINPVATLRPERSTTQ